MVRTTLGLLLLCAVPAAADELPVVILQKAAYAFERVERSTRFPEDLAFDAMKRPPDAPDGQEYVVLRFNRLHPVDGEAPTEMDSILTGDDGVVHGKVHSTTRCLDGRCWAGLTFLVPDQGQPYRWTWDDVVIDVPAP